MKNIDIRRVCIHECCHAVAARLFRDKMAIEEIAVNADLVAEGQDQGALNVRGPRLNNAHGFIALAITYLAGVIGENTYLLGRDAIKEKREGILADNKIIDWLHGGGDLLAFQHLASTFSLLYQVNDHTLKEFCIRFLIDFLSDREVWYMVEKLCDELGRKDDLKLNEEELESVFIHIGIDELLDNKGNKYLNDAMKS